LSAAAGLDVPITIDGYVMPSSFSKLLHMIGALLGFALAIIPEFHPGWNAPSSLGQLATALGGSGVTAASVFSYMTHEKTATKANAANFAAQAQMDAVSAVALAGKLAPQVENDVNTTVLPFINQVFPQYSKGVDTRIAGIENDFNQALATVTQVSASPSVQELFAQFGPMLDQWYISKFKPAASAAPTLITPASISTDPTLPTVLPI
jgi:hypothetical protein